VKHRILALPCAALFLAASLAAAQTPTKVGVIQIQTALVSTKDGQKAVQDLESRMAPKQREMERKRTELQELQEKLQKGGNAMAQAAKDDLARTIDQKTKSYNRDMEDARAELETEQRKLLEDLSGKMQVAIDKFALANGYAVILDVSNKNGNVL
jgi:outer membrane protein